MYYKKLFPFASVESFGDIALFFSEQNTVGVALTRWLAENASKNIDAIGFRASFLLQFQLLEWCRTDNVDCHHLLSNFAAACDQNMLVVIYIYI